MGFNNLCFLKRLLSVYRIHYAFTSLIQHNPVGFGVVLAIEQRIFDEKDSKGRTALMEAVVSCQVYVINLLIVNGANINAQDDEGCTCLMRAAYAGNSDLYDMLVRAGADENIKDNKGKTAADYRK